jgi:hypothetical protein
MKDTCHFTGMVASTSADGFLSIPGNIVSPDMLKGMHKVFDLNDDPLTKELFEEVNVWLRKKPIPDFLNKAGYFGSPEWWHAIETGFLPVRFIDGVIKFAGLRKDEFEEEWEELDIISNGKVVTTSLWGNKEMYKAGKRIVLESLEITFPKEHTLLPSFWQAWLRIWVAVK